ncbi:MAG: hypothetical protein QOE05_2023 [Actinomycetota bacterium]|nr:hypothetical protein [Actinomycetota bacterium]
MLDLSVTAITVIGIIVAAIGLAAVIYLLRNND